MRAFRYLKNKYKGGLVLNIAIIICAVGKECVKEMETGENHDISMYATGTLPIWVPRSAMTYVVSLSEIFHTLII